jgi:hypothetical protein
MLDRSWWTDEQSVEDANVRMLEIKHVNHGITTKYLQSTGTRQLSDKNMHMGDPIGRHGSTTPLQIVMVA